MLRVDQSGGVDCREHRVFISLQRGELTSCFSSLMTSMSGCVVWLQQGECSRTWPFRRGEWHDRDEDDHGITHERNGTYIHYYTLYIPPISSLSLSLFSLSPPLSLSLLCRRKIVTSRCSCYWRARDGVSRSWWLSIHRPLLPTPMESAVRQRLPIVSIFLLVHYII